MALREYLGAPVFLIDHSSTVRNSLASMLTPHGLKVLSAARTSEAALRQIRRRKPPVVLLDAALGNHRPVAAVEAIRKVSPATRIVVMHLLPARDDLVALVRAGVSGFIMKDASAAEFAATLRAVADGDNVLPLPMVKTIFTLIAKQAAARGGNGAGNGARITAREMQVIEAIAEGLSNKEISGRLRVATHTVKSHVHNILDKLGLRSRLEIAAYAHTSGNGGSR